MKFGRISAGDDLSSPAFAMTLVNHAYFNGILFDTTCGNYRSTCSNIIVQCVAGIHWEWYVLQKPAVIVYTAYIFQRVSFVRQRLQQQGMQIDDAPGDEEVRETYNFAPGYNGVVYCSDTQGRNHHAAREEEHPQEGATTAAQEHDDEAGEHRSVENEQKARKYKLQSMKWGLVPFWTKHKPSYGSLMNTINCRDDSLIEDRGMWTSMKRKKRCIVVCQGFYEWLKKGPGGKEKIPHFVKRKDGELMCFAGLWDRVRYEGMCIWRIYFHVRVANCFLNADSDEDLYTYTIITTSSNPYLGFLHDRMPVILDQGSDAMKAWLDPDRTAWSKELQSILKPYEGELECYPVSKEVGKVGNNSPDFLIPLNSKENKHNIANFFSNAKQKNYEKALKTEDKVTRDDDEKRETQETERSEDNAPVPVPGIKREHTPEESQVADSGQKRQKAQTPQKPQRLGAQATKADENKSPDGSQKITSFFKK